MTHDAGAIHGRLDALHEHFLTERAEAQQHADDAHRELSEARNDQPSPEEPQGGPPAQTP